MNTPKYGLDVSSNFKDTYKKGENFTVNGSCSRAAPAVRITCPSQKRNNRSSKPTSNSTTSALYTTGNLWKIPPASTWSVHS